MSVKKRCSKGHYYDSKFAYCPYCEGSEKAFTGEKKRKTGHFSGILQKSFSHQKKEVEVKSEDIHGVKTVYAKNTNLQDNQKTEYLSCNSSDNDKTEYISKDYQTDDVKTEYLGRQQINNEDVNLDDMKTEYLSKKESAKQGISLGHGDMASLLATKIPLNAVVGWLVCINGEMTGETLTIRRGKNSITQIGNIFDISNELIKNCHFEVIFDEKGRKYFITANAENIGLNSRKIKGKRSLFDGSIIQTNKTLFEFVAYCKGINKWQR